MLRFGKSLTSIIAVILALVFAVTPVFAAIFTATLLVQNATATNYDMLGMRVPANVTWWDDNNYIDNDGRDVQIALGTTVKPRMLQDNNIFIADAINGNSSNSYTLTTGEASVDFYIIPGNGGYYTVSDSVTLALGSDWSMAWTDAWLNTGTSGNIADKPSDNTTAKPNNFNIATGSGNITATIGGAIPFGTLTDVSANWTNEASAIDNDTATYASSAGIGVGFTTGNLTTSFSSRTMSNIRYYITSSPAVTLTMVVDIFYGGGWNGIFSGTVTQGSYQDINFAPQTGVTQMRLNITHSAVGAFAEVRLNEIQYWTNASVTQAVSAGEHDLLVGMDSPFLYMATDNNSALPPVSANLTLNAPFWQSEEYAAPGGTFQTIDSNGFTATVTGATWTLNEGYTLDGVNDLITILDDPALDITGEITIIQWINPDATISGVKGIVVKDRVNGYSLNYRNDAGVDAERPFLMIANNVLYTSTNAAPVSTWTMVGATHIDGTYDRTWINGVMDTEDTTVIGTMVANPANLTFGYNYVSWTYFKGDLGWGMIFDRALSGDEMLQIFNATKSWYLGGDIQTYSTLVSVPDNANDYVFNESAAVSYAGAVEVTISSVQAAYWNPNDIISGTTLPDRSVNSNDGTFTFGTNPAGILIDLGPFTVASTDTKPLEITTPDSLDIVTAPDDMVLNDFEMTMPNNEFYFLIQWTSTVSGLDINTIWWFVIAVFTIGAMAVVLKYTQNVWWAGFSGCAVAWFFNSMSGLEWWMPVPVLMATIFIGLWKRSAEV